MSFKRIPSEPRHAVNEFGEVMNIRTKRILKGYRDKNNRIIVTMAPFYHQRPVHELVMETFNPCDDSGMCIVHKDGDNSNNALNNLKWMSKREYQHQLYFSGLNHDHCGKQARPIKINETDMEFGTITECAKYLGVTSGAVWQQVHGRTKTCKGYTFTLL